jgi:hypothetical protein
MDRRVELDPRFLRQVVLVEVGPAGQERIARATAAVGGAGLAAEIATRYAERAGFAAVAPGSIDRSEAVVVGDAAAAVLDGSRAALRAILAAARGDG